MIDDLSLKPVQRLEKPHAVEGACKTPNSPPVAKSQALGEKKYTKEELKLMVEEANKTLSENKITQVKYEMHEGTKSIIVKIVDSDTNEVIKEIPSEKLLDYAAGMEKLLGIIVDKKI